MTARAAAAVTLIFAIGAARAHAQTPNSAGAPDAGSNSSGPGAAGSSNTAPTPPPPTPPAGAAPEGRANRRPDTVDITLVGGAAAYDGLRARVGDRMPFGVSLLWSRLDRFNPLAELLRGVPGTRTTTFRCWVDLSDLGHATLYFADQRGERFLVRELPLSGRFDEVDQQSVAQVMELSISALIENDEIGFSRAQARELLARAKPPIVQSAASGAAPPAPVRRWNLTTGLFYAIEDVGSGVPLAHGPGLIGTLAREHAGVWLAGQYQVPAEARQPEIGLRLQTISARAGVGAHWGRYRARLGAGANWTHVTPLAGAAAANPMLAAPHWSMSWVASAAVAARLPLEGAFGDLLALSLVLFADAMPSTTEFRFQDATGTHVAFAPRRLRPGLALELAY